MEASAPETILANSPELYAGYRERWNKKEWGDESLPRTLDEYFNEALAKGGWDGLARPTPGDPPQVMIGSSGSPLLGRSSR